VSGMLTQAGHSGGHIADEPGGWLNASETCLVGQTPVCCVAQGTSVHLSVP
jgi:hypothetical protein